MRIHVSNLFAVAALIALVSFSAQAQTVKTQIAFPQFVQGIAASPATNQIYVVVVSGTSTSDTLAVINGSTDTVVANIPVPAGAYVPAVNVLTNRVYIATCNYLVDPTPCSVTVVDGNTGTVVASVPVTTTPGGGLLGIVVDPITFNVYVANASDNVIDIISGFKNRIVGTINLNGAAPQGLGFNAFNRELYITFGTNQIGIVNTAKKHPVVAMASVGNTTYNAAANLASGNVFVTDTQYDTGTTDVLSANGTALAQVAVDPNPWGVDVDPITNLAFVANSEFGSVTAIDGSTNTATAASPIEDVPALFVAVNFATEKVYVAGSQYVTVLTEK